MPFPFASPDRLLAHFERTGDPRSLGRLFDRTAPELLRIAAWLAGNRNDAEDLLQRTFLTVLTSRGNYDVGRRALPWLSGILGNHAKKLQEQRARRDELRPPAGERDPAAAAADGEFAAAVARVRAELGSPYAEVLDLHLAEGLDARRIAERLGRPAGTVRTQIVRGLELLRRHLPSGFVAGVVLFSASAQAATLAAVRSAVLAHSAPSGAVAAAAGGAGLLGFGGLLMGKKLVWLAAAALLVLGGGTWWWQQRAAEVATPIAPTPAAASLPVASATPPANAAAPISAPAMREEPERSDGVVAEPGFATLVVHVHWADDGTPAASVGVMAAPQPECRVREREGVTSSDGTLVLRHLRPGACTVRAMFSPSQELALADGQVTVIDFKARRAGVASGTVVNDRGQVIAGARIWVSAFDGPWRGFEVARSDASGRFSVPCVPRMCVGARKAGYAPSRLIEVTETTPQLELTLAGPGGTVRGRVVDTEHRALAAAVVEIGWKGGWVVPTGATGVSAVMATAPMLTTDERGEFSFEGVAPGDIGVRAWADGCAPVEERVLVEARQTASVEVVLPRGAIVEGAVRDTRGDVVAGATVERSGAYFDFARSRTLTDARGAFRLENLPLGTVALEVDSRSGGVRATIVTAAGGVSPWNPVVGAAGARLEGRVVGPHGEPLAELFVGIVAGNTPAATNTTGTDAKGTFAFDDLAQKTVDLLIESSQGQLARRKDVPVGAEPIVVTLSADELPSVHVRGRVRDSEGKPIAASVVLMNRAFGMGQGVTTRADGTFDRGPIAAGVYSLEVDARGFGHVPIDCLTLHAGEERMLPDIVLARAGRVQLELRDLGQPMCQLKIVRDDGVTMTWVMSEGARATAELPPGSYTAATQLGNRRIGSVAFRVRSGETVAATIAFVTGNDVAVECRTGPMPASSTVLVLVRDVAGTLVDIAEFHMLHQKGDEASNWTCSLVAGQYQIEARASDGRTAIANVTVRDGGEKPRVVLDLTAGH